MRINLKNPFHVLAVRIVRRIAPDVSKDSSKRAPSSKRTIPARAGASGSYLPGSSAKLNRELMELGSGRKNCVETYYVRKIERFLEIALVCLAILIAVLVYDHRQDRRVTGGVLARPGYGEKAVEQSLVLEIGAGSDEAESESFDVSLDARAYTAAQVKALLKDAAGRLEEQLPGENRTLDEVRLPLYLPATLEDGTVTVEYYITPSGIIDEDGSIYGEVGQDGTLVTIMATLACQDKTSTYECAARIYPPILTEEEQLRENIRSEVEKASKAQPSDAEVRLPESVDGRQLRWFYPRESSLTVLFLLILILPIAFWAREDSKIHDAAKERLSQLELDYSQLLWKLTMLLSAGLTIRGAFTRIADQYEAEHTSRRYVYEEILLTLREMNSGVPEAGAYENFGRRCSLPSYIKLGSLLSQNLKKGSRGLTALLEHEAVLSMEQHKMAVRKLGEKAGVKMLLPMILMFGVVLIILMVPAFLSM